MRKSIFQYDLFFLQIFDIFNQLLLDLPVNAAFHLNTHPLSGHTRVQTTHPPAYALTIQAFSAWTPVTLKFSIIRNNSHLVIITTFFR